MLFGSRFPEDLSELQLVRQVNRVKLAMATGATVVLVNHDNIYEALYDVLNQRYRRRLSSSDRHGDSGDATARQRRGSHLRASALPALQLGNVPPQTPRTGSSVELAPTLPPSDGGGPASTVNGTAAGGNPAVTPGDEPRLPTATEDGGDSTTCSYSWAADYEC